VFCVCGKKFYTIFTYAIKNNHEKNVNTKFFCRVIPNRNLYDKMYTFSAGLLLEFILYSLVPVNFG